jgi:hypothetical protein
MITGAKHHWRLKMKLPVILTLALSALLLIGCTGYASSPQYAAQQERLWGSPLSDDSGPEPEVVVEVDPVL